MKIRRLSNARLSSLACWKGEPSSRIQLQRGMKAAPGVTPLNSSLLTPLSPASAPDLEPLRVVPLSTSSRNSRGKNCLDISMVGPVRLRSAEHPLTDGISPRGPRAMPNMLQRVAAQVREGIQREPGSTGSQTTGFRSLERASSPSAYGFVFIAGVMTDPFMEREEGRRVPPRAR